MPVGGRPNPTQAAFADNQSSGTRELGGEQDAPSQERGGVQQTAGEPGPQLKAAASTGQVSLCRDTGHLGQISHSPGKARNLDL